MRDATLSAFERGTVPIASSGWTTHAPAMPVYPMLNCPVGADVVVIGAGLAGASTALHLAARGLKVTVLEAQQPAVGASGRNAGHLSPYMGSMAPLQRWPDHGRHLLELFTDRRRFVFELCEQYGIDADAANVGYLDVSRRSWWRSRFRKSVRPWKALGYDVESVGGSELATLTGSQEYSCGLYWRDGGRVNPFLLTHGMIAAAQQRGAQIFGDSPVIGCRRVGEGWEVWTSNGTVRADNVVICTNGHAGNLFFPEISQTNYPCVACGLATKPLDAAVLAYINPSRVAIMQHPVGLNPLVIDGHGRLITAKIPNAHKADQSDLYFSQFLDFLHRAFPATRDVTIELQSYWTGRTFNSSNNYPKLYSPAPGIFALVNLGAWGNIMAPLLGMNLADALAADKLSDLALPIEPVRTVKHPMMLEFSVRKMLIPAAKLADHMGVF